jgi:hypothetical protein
VARPNRRGCDGRGRTWNARRIPHAGMVSLGHSFR